MTGKARSLLQDTASGLKIAVVETFRLRLPYRSVISFRSVRQSAAEYVILRIVLDSGAEGIAEAVCRPEHSGEDATLVAYQIETFLKPHLLGSDPFAHMALLASLARIRACRAAKALIDTALWDLRGKVLQQPVWRLLGGSTPGPVPLTWIAHGNARGAMVDEAKRMTLERGYKGIKLKTWKRSLEDIRMVAEVRQALGDDAIIYVDGNGTYTETEARTILMKVGEYNVSFIEEPCIFADPLRQAAMVSALPVALLGDQCCEGLDAVNTMLRLHAVGAVSVKLRRTGITESLKIFSLCEAAGIPVVIGTDSESRIGALVRMHLRAACPQLAPWPTETHFFDKLADDAFVGEFQFRDGTITPTDAPGFGASCDHRKLKQYAISN
ncbi:MAG: mandelate racemase/muconate lactonizing enzyme family protein [Xanthobacteraceae bacterium]